MPKATHRVKNSDGETVGFIIDGKFYNVYYTMNSISQIENLKITKNGKIRASRALEDIQYKQLNKIRLSDLVKNNPFKRDIQQKFEGWHNGVLSDLVLRVFGPRQVGKTTEVQKFAYKNYEYIIYVNLAHDEFYFADILDRDKQTYQIGDKLQDYCKRANLPAFKNNRKTILIIDEIQIKIDCYNAIRKLRDIYNIDIAVTGSYLAITLVNKAYFAPVGSVVDIHMSPLSFKEVCTAFGVDKVYNTVNIFAEQPDSKHKTLDTIYNIYRQIGGYPNVVRRYLQNKSINDAYKTIATIINVFIQESSAYFTNNRQPDIFRSVFREAATQMCSGNRNNNIKSLQQIINTIDKEDKTLASRKEIIDAVNWLTFSRVIGLCDQAVDGKLLDISQSKRIYYNDCGIASYILNRLTAIDKSSKQGLLTETFAYNELARLHIDESCESVFKNQYPIFSTLGTYELDFMECTMDDKIYGIEIKTNTGTTKSLNHYLSKGLIDRGIIAKMTSGHKGDKIDSIPIWALSLYKY